jgi:hypothetical protein
MTVKLTRPQPPSLIIEGESVDNTPLDPTPPKALYLLCSSCPYVLI